MRLEARIGKSTGDDEWIWIGRPPMPRAHVAQAAVATTNGDARFATIQWASMGLEYDNYVTVELYRTGARVAKAGLLYGSFCNSPQLLICRQLP
jgi:hypothetical protein